MPTPTAFLSNQRILLRAPEPVDVDILYKWENDTSLWNAGVTYAPLSRKQLWDYINNYDGDIFSAKQLRFIIDLNEKNIDSTENIDIESHDNSVKNQNKSKPLFPTSIGTIDLFDFDPINSRCGIGILIAEDYRQNGFGIDALNLVIDYCRKRLALHQLYCTIAEDNIPSRKLFDKAGFQTSGRLKSWLHTPPTYTSAYLLQKFL